MMYPYITLSDGTEIIHSHILDENKIIVNFERPTETGFDDARCELPSYKWLQVDGYSKQEIDFFEELLEHNVHLIYKYASNGGVHIA